MRIKVEVNTSERSPARDIMRFSFSIESPWFTCAAGVSTFDLAELSRPKRHASSSDPRVAICSAYGSHSNVSVSAPPTWSSAPAVPADLLLPPPR